MQLRREMQLRKASHELLKKWDQWTNGWMILAVWRNDLDAAIWGRGVYAQVI